LDTNPRPPLAVEAWSRRAQAAHQLVRSHLSATDHTEHLAALRRMLARRFLVVPLMDLDNALVLHPSPSPQGLADAVAGSLAMTTAAELPPGFQRLREGGWLQGPGVNAALAEGLFEGDPEERGRLRHLLEDLVRTPTGASRPAVDPAAPRIVTSAELAAQPAGASVAPVPPADHALLVYLPQRRRLGFADIQAMLFKGLKLLPCFGCRRYWLYAPGGFEVDYRRELAATYEYAVEGDRFFDRLAFLGPFDVAVLLVG